MSLKQACPELIIDHFPYVNYTFCLNKYNFIRNILINNLNEQFSNVQIEISSSLGIIDNYQIFIDQVSDDYLSFSQFDFTFNLPLLKSLTERDIDSIKITVSANELELVQKHFTIDVLPMDYYGGLQVLPELLSSYIISNHPIIYEIKTAAIKVLEENNLVASFDGYQSKDRERVLQVVSAVYRAIQNQELIYSSMPASFESRGQRIRLIDQVISTKFGNCIDISLLFSACLEAINLNPILIITKGHAFVGVWLEDRRFDSMINFDQAAIAKRIAAGIKEIAVIETTNLCKGESLSFSKAVKSAEIQLMNEENFLLSIDVRSCRSNGISPLPISKIEKDVKGIKAIDLEEYNADLDNDYDLGELYDSLELTELKNLTKQKIWERKLLDLSLRNNLLNIRFTKGMLQIVDLKINQLEDTLSNGKTYTIHPDNNQPVTRKYNNYITPLHQSLPLFKLAEDEFKYNRLLTSYHNDDLDAILNNLYRTSKLAEEENGKSTLYLGIGLLKWYDPKNKRQRLAPVLLIPVELSRRSVKAKYTLRSREEETMINITLVEYLKQEFKLDLHALETLPVDESGVDVLRVLAIVRNAVLDLEGWDVLEQIVLGTFSFNKLILWQDISRFSEEIQKSSIVKSLIDGRLSATLESVDKDDTELENLPAAQLTLPIAVDNSQLNAIKNANLNRTFILHGPPGTGKSQTITNIIADALANEKKVLFVAAKKAALDVVHQRLENIGLGPFTLEVHSNKSKKTDVLKQFERTLDVPKYQLSKDYLEEGKRLDERRKELSKYVSLLHQKNEIDWSLFDSISFLESHRITYDKDLKIELNVARIERGKWNLWNDWIIPFATVVSKINLPHAHPLRSIKTHVHQFENKQNIDTAIDKYIQNKQAADRIFQQFKLSEHQFTDFKPALSFIKDKQFKTLLFYFYFDDEKLLLLKYWIKIQSEKQQAESFILSIFNKSILKFDAENLSLQWNKSKYTWFLPKWFKQRKVKSQLQAFAHTKLTADHDIDQIFLNLEEFKTLQDGLSEAKYREFDSLYNLYLNNEKLDLQTLDIDLKTLGKLYKLVQQVQGTDAKAWILYNFIDQDIPHSIHDILNQAESLELATNNLLTYLYALQPFERLIEIKDNLYRLEDWINYNIYKLKASGLGLDWFINQLENGFLDPQSIQLDFLKTLHLNHFIQRINQSEVLNSFDASIYESFITQYKEMHQEFVTISRNQLIVKLSANIPNFTYEAAQSSEVGILQKAIRSRGRGLSIRKLFDQIPTLIPRLKPCMLMSPISVAQYFDVNTNHFDLVIFDEASQLPTSEAISALSRAKQAIIVGDPKQMPPTSFFTTSKIDEDNLEIEDLESILDDCLALSIPSNYLLRHYRSKHESLISFSNNNFYDSKLLTFPSPDDLNQKVTFNYVEGSYDKGRTRTNIKEATAVINYIKNHLITNNNKTVGVVTFSQAQQSLIEDLLQKLYIEKPELEEFALNLEESIFIKNLENVQGDERDIILFSIGYGPDEEGKISMNFGPLNRDGGWRRLNVAVTRARYEMKVFSSIRAEQIDLTRVKSDGVKGLKDFLNFAEKGSFILKIEPQETSKASLVDVIADALQEKGIKVQKYIGTSAYKVDIGVFHPTNDKEYILGILIDGINYLDINTTNDRELLAPNVLRSLGWNIYRIWTLDWLKNKEHILNEIQNEIADVLSRPKLADKENNLIAEEIESQEPSVEFLEVSDDANQQMRIPYESAVLVAWPFANPERIYYTENKKLILDQIEKLVAVEAPISERMLVRKILKLWKVTRAGTKLSAYVIERAALIPSIKKITTHQDFYWTNEMDPQTLTTYRDNSIEKRAIDDISQEEIKVAIMEVMHISLSIEAQDLVRMVAKVFGFLKIGSQIESVISQAYEQLIKEDLLELKSSRLILKS